jgi:hypothetical protein
MDVSGGTQANGNKIQIYDCNDVSNVNPNQAWTVTKTGGAIQWTTHSSWCLDNQHGTSTNVSVFSPYSLTLSNTIPLLDPALDLQR